MFHIGQKVVCVDDSYPPEDMDFFCVDGVERRLTGDLDGLSRGRIYTIRSLGVSFVTGEPVLRLEEILREIGPSDPNEPGFHASRFRPLIERKTDTGFSILEEIRKRESVPADERVREPARVTSR